MRILIIGSKGFIGSHLTLTMRALGHTVTESLSSFDEREVAQGLRTQKIAGFFRSHQPDVCINCSGAAHVPSSFSDPLNDFSKNTVAVYEMLAAIRAYSPHTRFVHLSSAAVYGNPAVLPISERAPVNPVSPYGFHKLAAEQFCREFAVLYGTKTVSLRIFSAYGPGLRKQLLWDTYQKWKQSEVIELFGTGDETRDFIFIDDLCSAIAAVVQNGTFGGETVNMASGTSISVRDIVCKLVDELGGNKEIRFIGQKRPGDPDCWRADVSSLKELGFNTQTSIETGVKATAQWQKEHG